MREIIQEWVKGKFPKNFEIIDIGAGVSPALGTTRAVDADGRLFTKDGLRLKKKVAVPDSLIEYINYDASCLPYDTGFFDRGISRWAIGARIHGMKPILELYRVLKTGGKIYIAILEEDKRYIPTTKRILTIVGFKILCVYNGEYTETNKRGREVKAKEQIIHAVKVRAAKKENE